MPEFELVKILAQTVVQVREDGKVVGEIAGEIVPCFSQEQLAATWPKIEQEVADRNAAEHAAENGGSAVVEEEIPVE